MNRAESQQFRDRMEALESRVLDLEKNGNSALTERVVKLEGELRAMKARMGKRLEVA